MSGFLERAKAILDGSWAALLARAERGPVEDAAPPEIAKDIRRAVNSRTKTYRYVLPTQLLAKLVDRGLDSRCLQAARGGPGAFDARTVAHNVIVPFDQANHCVLGGAPEPYVNNPLRVPEVTEKHRAAQRNKEDWDVLCRVLSQVEAARSLDLPPQAFEQVLVEVYRRLSEVRIAYPAPQRASLSSAMESIARFLDKPSGGDRLLACTAALFSLLGRRFQLFSEVRRASITAADAATGMLADLECVSDSGEVVIAVEVKDRELTITQLQAKMTDIRQMRVSEVFFVAQRGIAEPNGDAIARHVQQEFATGQNVYITDLLKLADVCLSLLGERGRREFLCEVGAQLDRYRSEIAHRRAWADLVRSL